MWCTYATLSRFIGASFAQTAVYSFKTTVLMEGIDAVIADSAKLLGFEKLKDKQMEAVKAFVSGLDVFVSLPTGYGKSVIYAVFPLALDTL